MKEEIQVYQVAFLKNVCPDNAELRIGSSYTAILLNLAILSFMVYVDEYD